MPYLPELNEGNQTRAVVDVFGGYNHNLKINEGEWYEESNLTSEHYPMFSNRRPRGLYKTVPELGGIISKDALAWIDGDKLYYNDYEVQGVRLNGRLPKQLVSMGAYLCIFPDKVWYNTANGDYGEMGYLYQSPENGSISYEPCKANGEVYGEINASYAEPQEPSNGQYWMDTSGETHVLKQYSSSSAMWVEIPTVYTKISCNAIGAGFEQYDGVVISGVSYDAEDASMKQQLEALNTSTVIRAKGDNYIVVTGILDEAYTQNGQITVNRAVPDIDFVCEANNRLWGCKYGLVGGKTVNEIYACKQGDFKNWNCFMGLSTDSYTASVGTDGKFTGAIAYLGNPLFFKENYIHRMSGTMPSNYQMTTTACRGVQDGSGASLAIVNEILYYKSRSDVCAYDGSLPVGVSAQFGTDLYSDAVAGAHGGKYYISMRGNGGWNLFVYDTQRGVWHREDGLHAIGFASWSDELYIAAGNRIIAENGTASRYESLVPWSATSGLIGYELIDHQYISRFNIRMKLADGAKCALAIEYDSDGNWIEQGIIYGRGTNSFVIPVIPQRCDHFRFRLSGEGDIRIYSIAKIIEQGSDA